MLVKIARFDLVSKLGIAVIGLGSEFQKFWVVMKIEEGLIIGFEFHFRFNWFWCLRNSSFWV